MDMSVQFAKFNALNTAGTLIVTRRFAEALRTRYLPRLIEACATSAEGGIVDFVYGALMGPELPLHRFSLRIPTFDTITRPGAVRPHRSLELMVLSAAADSVEDADVDLLENSTKLVEVRVDASGRKYHAVNIDKLLECRPFEDLLLRTLVGLC